MHVLRVVMRYFVIVYRDNLCGTIFFACYRDNCHRNNNVLKIKAQAQIQVHMLLFTLTHVVSQLH